MICIIDYELGNVMSVKNAINKIGYECKISDKIEDIKLSKILILPGVGSFKKGMDNLKTKNLINILNEEVLIKEKTILGICLGFQLMSKKSYEFGEHNGLGWINMTVDKIDSKNYNLPHVGWNKTNISNDNPIFKNIKNEELFYYNHSYCVQKINDPKFKILASCNYGDNFVSIGFKKNIYGIQPHPEKSQKQGLVFLENFIKEKC